MKHLKKYNENKSDSIFSPEDINDIKDVFQDLIDEYDMVSTTKFPHTQNINLGISYRIIILQEKFLIRIYTPSKDGQIVPFKNDVYIFKSISDFIERLQLMGYIVTRNYVYEDDNYQNLDFIIIRIKKT